MTKIDRCSVCFIGAALVLAVLGWRGGLVMSFSAQKPSDYADDYTVFDLKKHSERRARSAKA